jgi:hydrogenase nickel incorporation protein HypB
LEIKVLRNILEANEAIAAENRRQFDQHSVYVVNILASPGAGKTSLLERTLEGLQGELAMGDIAGRIDAERIGRHGVPVLQINTGGTCHLDANMIRRALGEMSLERLDLLFIENVGNLVCPAEFVLGEDAKVTVWSVAEGDDKAEKYPRVFLESQALVINKTDLLGLTDFDLDRARRSALAVNPRLAIFALSCRTGEGLAGWLDWLRAQVNGRRRADSRL